MTVMRDETDKNRNAETLVLRFLYPLSIFLLALIPRALNLQRFVTADEAKWVYRSAQFLLAFLQGDFASTAVNLTPAVTTTWLGSAGLSVYYLLHRPELDIPFTDWLATLPPFRVDLPVLAATRWAMVIFSSLAITAIYLLARRLWGRNIAFTGAALMALSPHTLALTRIIGHDAPAALFVTLSLLSLFAVSFQPFDRLRTGRSAVGGRRSAVCLAFAFRRSGGIGVSLQVAGVFSCPFCDVVFGRRKLRC